MASNKEQLWLLKSLDALFKAGKADEVERIVKEMLEELETVNK